MSKRIARVLIALLATGSLLASVLRIDWVEEVGAPPQVPKVPVSLSPVPTPDPLRDLPAGVRVIARQVEEIRGLRFRRAFRVKVVRPRALETKIGALVDKELDPTEIKDNAVTLRHLGLLGEGVDLAETLDAYYRGSVAGIYLPEETALYVGSSDGSLSPATRFYVAHELEHALIDQHFNLGPLEALSEDLSTAEEAFAFQSLSEGDAVAVAARWMVAHTTRAQRIEMEREFAEAGGPPPGPVFLERSFSFPYAYGGTFVEALLARGGWDAVNRAFGAPPTTTEQILDPERFLTGEGAIVVDDFVAASDLRVIEEGSFGRYDLQLTLDGDPALETGVAAAEAEKAAEGWGGGRYQTLRTAGSAATVVRVAFDDEHELREAIPVLDAWLPTRGKGSRFVVGGGGGWRSERLSLGWIEVREGFSLVIGSDHGLVERLLDRERRARVRAA